MSNVSRKAFLSVLPSVLSPKEKLAQVIADELIGLYNDTDLLRIYARIDELDEQLLDILAYDYKIDWWDKGLTLAEKRRTCVVDDAAWKRQPLPRPRKDIDVLHAGVLVVAT